MMQYAIAVDLILLQIHFNPSIAFMSRLSILILKDRKKVSVLGQYET